MKNKILKLFGLIDDPITIEDFASKFYNEVDRTKTVAKTCVTKEQVKNAERMFELIKIKWNTILMENNTLNIIFHSEEKNFYQDIAQVKSKILNI